jgi:hypothetical protein
MAQQARRICCLAGFLAFIIGGFVIHIREFLTVEAWHGRLL